MAARPFVVVLFTLFLLTTPAFAASRTEDFVFARMTSLWSKLTTRVSHLWSADVVPGGGGTGGTNGGSSGSGTSLDPSGGRW